MIHNNNTRNMSNIHIPHHKTKLYEQSIDYKGIHLYNKLPEDNKTAKNFKKKLYNFLLGKNYCTTQEYLSAETSCGRPDV